MTASHSDPSNYIQRLNEIIKQILPDEPNTFVLKNKSYEFCLDASPTFPQSTKIANAETRAFIIKNLFAINRLNGQVRNVKNNTYIVIDQQHAEKFLNERSNQEAVLQKIRDRKKDEANRYLMIAGGEKNTSKKNKYVESALLLDQTKNEKLSSDAVPLIVELAKYEVEKRQFELAKLRFEHNKNKKEIDNQDDGFVYKNRMGGLEKYLRGTVADNEEKRNSILAERKKITLSNILNLLNIIFKSNPPKLSAAAETILKMDAKDSLDLNIPDNKGCTLLHYSALYFEDDSLYQNLTIALIKKGASLVTKNKDGNLPAIDKTSPEIIKVIKSETRLDSVKAAVIALDDFIIKEKVITLDDFIIKENNKIWLAKRRCRAYLDKLKEFFSNNNVSPEFRAEYTMFLANQKTHLLKLQDGPIFSSFGKGNEDFKEALKIISTQKPIFAQQNLANKMEKK